MTGTTHWVSVTPLDGAWFHALCTCEWKGTARVQAATAEDDARSHGANKGHVWLVGGAA